MTIMRCMKREVVSIGEDASIGRAAQMLVEYHIGTLPVINAQGRLTGLVQLRDLLELVMPDFVRLVQDFDFVQDFGAIESFLPSIAKLAEPVTHIMRPPIFVEEHSGMLRAMAILQTNRLLDVPVVDQTGHLVGIASRVDIGTALLKNWDMVEKG